LHEEVVRTALREQKIAAVAPNHQDTFQSCTDVDW
jgi:hypothetical protein